MAEHAVLRFADGGWMELVGHHPALDLVNTVSWRRDPARWVDRIADAAELVRWAGFAGLINAKQAKAFATEVQREPRLAGWVVVEIRDLREALHDVLAPLAVGETSVPEDVAALQAILQASLAEARWSGVLPLRWSVPTDSVRRLPALLALQVRALLDVDGAGRLRVCADDTCGWLFLDRSKNASRRWCSSADCGNRAKARRHYQRTRRTHDPQG
ncbi:hypothetical protein N802_16295 [Knoellia sinensis KCTC 19936]|uniref:Zinc finger CGNR domain-containing protein n=1 Tax=Knoellia sinensis KCTC 19936 TaxID=1385520 RepID=A0A0A0J6X9_9MICO|nr:CGNR zinc finger domain-containing protein [Knoellia sinensis]KGN32938.1 hypothetical protein N802_16295 [Knoellia sinensis KCTC 19936]